MRHRKKFKFGKGSDQKRKLLKSLGSSLVLYEKIATTEKNAKATRGYVEKLVTRAKTDNLQNKRILLAKLSIMAARKALEVLGPKFKDRKGGYTRMIKLVHSSSGNSKVLLEFVE